MKKSSRFLTAVVALPLVVLTGCSGDDEPDATATAVQTPTTAATSVAEPTATAVPDTPSRATASPTSTPSPTATPEPEPTTGLDALSLVYVDTRRGQGGDIYVADADGSNQRLVLSDPAYRRTLDVRGETLAILQQGAISFVDLADGDVSASVTLPADLIVSSGRFFDDGVFLYTFGSGCGSSAGGGLARVELPAGESTELFTSELGQAIVGLDVATNTVAVVPRGCDVGIAGIDVYDALTGRLRNSLAVEGCGWAIAALDQGKAVTSWQSCTPPLNHNGADVTVYDFGIVGPTGKDVTVPVADPNAALWLRRPGHAEVAFGTTTTLGAGPGNERGAGIYVLLLTSRQFVRLVEGEGAEQYPVAWSPDGRYLLYSVVEAQGVCHFAYVDTDADDPERVAINPDITPCGVNGDVVGWTQLL